MAYEQGILTQKKITRLQRWALSYHLMKCAERKSNERHEFVKVLTRIIDPKLYDAAFGAEELEGDGSGDTVVDVEEIDDEMRAFLKSLEVPHQINAGPTDEDGWA